MLKNNSSWQVLNRKITLSILAALATLIVLTQSNPGTVLPNRDYGFYSYIGLQVLRGNIPYKDVWESKPPAIFYLNAAALSLGRGYRWGIWLVEFAFLFASILVSYSLFKKLWGTTPALFGAATWLLGMNLTLQGGNYTEEYPLLFHFLSFTLLLYLIENPKQRLVNLIIGLLFSISFLFRPNNAVVEAVVILVLGATLLWQRQWKDLFNTVLWVTLGIVIPLAITSAYFAYQGLFQDMLNASIIYNLTYSATDQSASSPLLVGFKFLNITAWIGLVGYLLMFTKINEIRKSAYLPFFIALAVDVPAVVAFSDPAKRNYGHYFMNWLPFIGVLAALAFHSIREKLFPKFNETLFISLFFAIAIGVFVFNGNASTYVKAIDHFFTTSDREARSPISIYVDNHTNPGEYVLFWATHPGENFMSHRDAPMTALFYPNMVKSDISDRLNDQFLTELQTKTPVLIVDMGRLTIPSLDPIRREEQKAMGVYPANPPHNLDEVLAFIEKNYYLEAEVKGRSIYRLSGTQEP
ncbi:MAG: glycosyltransferase family 39 protein [Anaerolineales bacterium]|nr:glycosyltransferase family 39 protein [Anaerolineales bacterium]